MKENGYEQGYPGSSGEQKWSWLGIEVKLQFLVTPRDDIEEEKESAFDEDLWRDI